MLDLDFLIPVAIFGFGGYFLYKLFELYAMRNERKRAKKLAQLNA